MYYLRNHNDTFVLIKIQEDFHFLKSCTKLLVISEL